MKTLTIYYLFYLYLTILKVNSIIYKETEPPMNLQNIYTIYTSWYTIDKMKPIITYEYIYFNIGNSLRAFNYEKLKFTNFYIASIFYPFGSSNYYIKPIDNYYSMFNPYLVFFTKDCTLKSYHYRDIQFDRDNLYLDHKFDELERNKDCYDSLRMYYDSVSRYATVYNLNSNKIIVFNLYDAADQFNPNYEKFAEKSMDDNIKKAFVFTIKSGKKIVLIGIDKQGEVKFWNLKDDSFFSSDLIKSFKLNPIYLANPDEEFSTIINKDKLLIIINYDFIIFDIKETTKINTQNKFIKNVSCVLGLIDGNALVGTDNGFLYLIKYQNKKIEILDKNKLCGNKKIFSLSSISNCAGKEDCYVIAANCGYLKIFQIKDDISNKNTEF